MIEALTEFAHLYDDIEFVALEFVELTFILIQFSAVDVIRAQSPCPVGFDDLYAMVIVQGVVA